MEEGKTIPIKFTFSPYKFEDKQHCVEKDESGKRRRYLRGITSGSKIDGHGERLSQKCIKSLQDQANSGDILLYEGQHGVDYTDDIGKLVQAEILPEGDWYTEYRLFDADDMQGSVTLEKANKLWKQINGLPPYTKPRQKGFSIEGDIPSGGIVEMDAHGRRIIDDVILHGVLVVPRPAYTQSIAHAVYKALGLPTPWKIRSTLLRGHITERIDQQEQEKNFFERKCRIQDAFDEIVREIIEGEPSQYSERFEELFDEYKQLMIPLIIESKDVYVMTPGVTEESSSDNSANTRETLFNELRKSLTGLDNLIKVRKEQLHAIT